MHRSSKLALVITSLVAAALTFSACGGGSNDSAVEGLASFMPPDTAVYIQAAVRPDDDVKAKADDITKQLTGSTLGDQIQSMLESQGGDIDFKADVDPWLGDNAALYVGAESVSTENGIAESALSGLGDSSKGAVIETKSADSAQTFLDDHSKPGSAGEYEGVSYVTMKGDEAVAGLIDGKLAIAEDLSGLKKIVDASKGESLEDSEGFSAVADKVVDGSLANLYVGNLASTGAALDNGSAGVFKALGVDPEKTGAMISLVPEENEISIRGYTADQPDLKAGDASGLISGFPADSVLALGVGNLGENATKVIDALDKDGIEGMLKPGQLSQGLDQLSEQGLDARALIESLNDLGLFVQGDNPKNLGGALVLTSSDLDTVRSSFKAITGLITLAADEDVKPLGGGLLGLRIRTDELPGKPVVFAIGKDRIVIGIGMRSARQALTASGEDLGSIQSFKSAQDSLGGTLSLFADPAGIGKLVDGYAQSDPEAATAAEIIKKFSFVAGGAGSDEGSSELNFGLNE